MRPRARTHLEARRALFRGGGGVAAPLPEEGCVLSTYTSISSLPASVASQPVAVAEPVSPPSEPAQPAASLISATPLGGVIPDRGGMPKAGGGGPKKGYGFGSGASWKSGKTIQTISVEPVTPPPVESVPEPVVQPEPVAPAVPASPLGSIPNRGGMPRDEFGHGNGPKKSFGIGGGASWKS